MPVYTFVAKDKNGKSIESSIDAADKITASEQLQRQGYFVISIKDNASVNMSARRTNLPKHRHQKFLRKKIKLADIITFARQIATMLEAGVSLMRGLEVIQSQIESEKLAQVIQRVKTDVEKGHSFSQALGRHPKVFNQFWVSLVEVGEASGTLPMVLNKLTFYLEQQQSFRSTVVSSIIYPAILFLVSVGAISFFALFVGPKF